MVTDGRLAEAEWLRQVADASLVPRLRLDQAQKPQARRVCDGLQRTGELLGRLRIERFLQKRWARGGDRGDLFQALILTDLDDLVIIAAAGAIDQRRYRGDP
jgi:hypothetical protein